MHYLQGNNYSNDGRLSIRCHGSQKEVAHFLSAERDKFSISSKNHPSVMKMKETISDEEKLM